VISQQSSGILTTSSAIATFALDCNFSRAFAVSQSRPTAQLSSYRFAPGLRLGPTTTTRSALPGTNLGVSQVVASRSPNRGSPW